MSVISVSYNFPAGFLWGITGNYDYFAGRDNYSMLFHLKDQSIDSICITLNWADFEPLKNNYDEARIDNVRTFLSRAHNQNIKPIILLDIGTVPQWQNLEKTEKNYSFSQERYNFTAYLANVLIPYTKIIGLICSEEALYSIKILSAELEAHKEIRKYIRSISEQINVGTVLPASIDKKANHGIRLIPRKLHLEPLKNTEMDFVGLPAKLEIQNALQNIFDKERVPLVYFTDRLNISPPTKRFDELLEKIYNIWHTYQHGWPVMGYFSEIDINTMGPETELLINTSKKNSLELSTENLNISEKWIHFLKD